MDMTALFQQSTSTQRVRSLRSLILVTALLWLAFLPGVVFGQFGEDAVLDLSLDDGTGHTALDASGNGYNAQLNGASWTTGQLGNALSFDGVDDFAYSSTTSALQLTGDLTFRIWVKPFSDASGWTGILTKHQSDTNSEFNLRVKDSITAQWYYGNGTKNACVLDWNPSTHLPLNTWTQITGVRDLGAGTMTLYFNGVAGPSRSTCGAAVANGAHLSIGKQNNLSRYFHGAIDEIELYDRAMTAAEVAWRYGLESGSSNLIPNADFESGSLDPLFPTTVRGTLTVDDTTSSQGQYSIRHEATENDSYTAPYIGTGAALAQASAGEKFQFSAMVKAAQNTNVRLRVFCLNSAFNSLGHGWATFTATPTWQRVATTYTCPTNTAYVSVRLDNTTTGRIVWWDDLYLVRAVNDAQFVSQSVPSTIGVGETATATVTMKNTGTTLWTREQYYRLGAPLNSTTWGFGRVQLDVGETVYPGQNKSFSFTITAPSTAGSYDFQWRMLEEAVQWFGDSSPQLAIVADDGTTPQAQMAFTVPFEEMVYPAETYDLGTAQTFHFTVPPGTTNLQVAGVTGPALVTVKPGYSQQGGEMPFTGQVQLSKKDAARHSPDENGLYSFVAEVELDFAGQTQTIFLEGQTKAATHGGMGPLVRSAGTGFFRIPQGQTLYLTGSHTWDNLVDKKPSQAFNYTSYLNMMQVKKHNFMRMWTWQNFDVFGAELAQGPLPWRWDSAEGCYDLYDGDLNFNDPSLFDEQKVLFNEEFFTRLRDRVTAAGNAGIYVDLMLFQGASVKDGGSEKPWRFHPLNILNNCEDVDGNLGEDDNEDGKKFHEVNFNSTDPMEAIVGKLQKAYIRRVIDTLRFHGNVLYEVANEDVGSPANEAWEYAVINFVTGNQPGQLADPHPFGMTSFGFGNPNDVLAASGADWISPATDNDPVEDYSYDPPAADGTGPVIISDNDHLRCILQTPSFPNECNFPWEIQDNYRQWIWKSLTRGHNVILMDAVERAPGAQDPTSYQAVNPGNPAFKYSRDYLGHARHFAEQLDLSAAKPMGSKCSTGYCLVEEGVAYLVYQPQNSAINVDLEPGAYSVEWFNPHALTSPPAKDAPIDAHIAANTTRLPENANVTTAGFMTFNRPFSCNGGLFECDSVLLLRRAGSPATPTNLNIKDLASNHIEIAWEAGEVGGVFGDPTSFNIYRGQGSTGDLILHETLTASARTYRDLTVQPNTTYRYEVSAVNQEGESPRSNLDSATTNGPPDLFVQSSNYYVGCSNCSGTGYTRYAFQANITNGGDHMSPTQISEVKGYFSTDQTFSPDDTVICWRENFTVGILRCGSDMNALGGGGNDTVTIYFDYLDQNFGPGYILMVADANNEVPESNESNNSVVFTDFEIPSPDGANLVVITGQNDLYVQPGETATLHATVSNTGDVTAGASNLGIYMAFPFDLSQPPPTTVTLLTREAFDPMAPGTSEERTGIQVMIPSNAALGRHELGYVADYDDDVAEREENDNLLRFWINVGLPPAVPDGFRREHEEYTDRIYLSWDSVGDATSYELLRHTSSFDCSSLPTGIVINPSLDEIEIDGTVMPGVTYYYRVRSVNNYGAGDCSPIISGSVTGP